MTREKTKIIVAVGASFAALVGGVFGVKYLQGPDAKTTSDTAAMTQAKEQAAAGDQIPAPPIGELPALLPPNKLDDPAPPPEALMPPPGKLDSVPKITVNPRPAKIKHDDPGADDPFPPPPPIIRVGLQEKDPPPPPGVGPIVLPAPTSGPTTPAPLEVPKPMAGDPPPLSVPMNPMNPPKSDTTVPGPPTLPMPADTSPKPMLSGPELAPLPPDKPKEKDPSSFPKTDDPKPLDLAKPDDAPPKPLDIPKPMADLPKPGDMPPKPLNIPKPMSDLPKPDSGPKPLDPPNPNSELPKPDLGPKPSLDPPPSGGSGPKPPLEFPKPPMAGGPMPPPSQDPPSNSRPTDNQPEPPVTSYEEEWHYCKQQGESLESISQKYYFTTKYEQALRRYNLDRNPARVFQDTRPSLQIGQVVKVPMPARVLERLYPDAVGGTKTPARPTSEPSGGGALRPAASLGPASGSGTDMGAAREYTVAHDNMTLRDVARDELGKEDQWHRIFLLNRWVNPSAPLNKGVKLFLPRTGNP